MNTEQELRNKHLLSLADGNRKSLQVAREAGATEEQLKALEEKFDADFNAWVKRYQS